MVDNKLFLTTKPPFSRTGISRGKPVNNSTQDGRFNYATLCCRGQIIAGQTSSLLQASCSTDKAERHDALCKVHWPWDSVMDWWHQGLNALSLSIYTQLAANTLSFHVFVSRTKQPRCAIGFVSAIANTTASPLEDQHAQLIFTKSHLLLECPKQQCGVLHREPSI